MKIKASQQAGFTLVEIMIVVAIIGLLAAIAIPNFVKARANSQTNACLTNIKQIANAKATWAMEQRKNNTDTPLEADLYGNAGYLRNKPKCPATDTDYNIKQVDQNPTCAIPEHNI